MVTSLKSLFSYFLITSCFLIQLIDIFSYFTLSSCFLTPLINTSDEIILFSKNYSIIYLSDKLLCILFGEISRWYQLHSLVNIYITYQTYSDYILYIKDPINAIIYKDTYFIGNIVFNLHLYHIIMFNNLDFWDCFHHILFAGIGMVPNMVWFGNINIINLLYFTGCGFTGAIEYFLLSLKKHNVISRNYQKLINSYIYNYIRYPSSIFCITMFYLHYNLGNLSISYFKLLFTMIISFFNGSYYNYLTLLSCGKLN